MEANGKRESFEWERIHLFDAALCDESEKERLWCSFLILSMRMCVLFS
jgi:hypothetical protein